MFLVIACFGVVFGLALLAEKELDHFSKLSIQSSKIDWILILGNGPGLTAALKDRLDNALIAYQLWPQARVLVTGTPDETIVMKEYLTSNNIPASVLVEEKESTSTWTSFKNSKKIIQDSEHIAIVTNEFHQRRSIATASLMGYKAVLFGKDTVSMEKRALYRVREHFSAIKWYLQSLLYKI